MWEGPEQDIQAEQRVVDSGGEGVEIVGDKVEARVEEQTDNVF